MDSIGRRRRFVLQRVIGRGSFGEVFLALQDSGAGFTRPVAIKLLDSSSSGSREVARRMRDEARLLGRLRSRHIVDVYDLVRLGDRWGIVMEYVAGADLDEVLARQAADATSFSPRAALAVGVAVTRALELAWSAADEVGMPLRVVHRDLKPANIRVSPEGEVKVLDFGVARFSLTAREANTRQPGWLGTERYMAPERILLEGDGPEGDVYALGATLVELILGRPLGRTPVLPERHAPFVEAALVDVRARIDAAPEVVDELVGLFRQMLAVRPADRPNASEARVVWQRLGRHVGGESLSRVAARYARVAEVAPTISPVTLEEGAVDDEAVAPVVTLADPDLPSFRPNIPAWRWAAAAAAGLGLGVALAVRAQGILFPVSAVAAEEVVVTAPAPAEVFEAASAPVLAIPVRDEVMVAVSAQALPVAPAPRAASPAATVRPAPAEAVAPVQTAPAPAVAPRLTLADYMDQVAATKTTQVANTAPRETLADYMDRVAASKAAGGAPRATVTEVASQVAAADLSGSGEAPRLTLADYMDQVAAAKAQAARTEAAAAPQAAATGPSGAGRIEKALVVVTGVDGFRVRCGDRAFDGTQSARLLDVPAGTCDITAWVAGGTVRGTARVDRPSEVRCAVQGEGIQCW